MVLRPLHFLNGSATPRAFLVFVFQPQHPDREPIPLMEVSDEGLSRDLLYIEMNSLYRDELTAHKQHTPIYTLKTQGGTTPSADSWPNDKILFGLFCE